jgi:hypothetical protein
MERVLKKLRDFFKIRLESALETERPAIGWQTAIRSGDQGDLT